MAENICAEYVFKGKDLSGMIFSKLTVLRFFGRTKTPSGTGTHYWWMCRCECGNEKPISGDRLNSGNSKSCGCGVVQSTIRRSTKHNHCHAFAQSRVYIIWAGMLDRCRNPNSKIYKHYGARGISVCNRWKEFANFLEDMGEPPFGPPHYSIDRINNDLGYSKDNCEWRTKKQQANNTRANKLLTAFGKTQTISQWADEYGIRQETLGQRIRVQKWDVEKAITEPIGPSGRRY